VYSRVVCLLPLDGVRSGLRDESRDGQLVRDLDGRGATGYDTGLELLVDLDGHAAHDRATTVSAMQSTMSARVRRSLMKMAAMWQMQDRTCRQLPAWGWRSTATADAADG